jgi:hypothetical protein
MQHIRLWVSPLGPDYPAAGLQGDASLSIRTQKLKKKDYRVYLKSIKFQGLPGACLDRT